MLHLLLFSACLLSPLASAASGNNDQLPIVDQISTTPVTADTETTTSVERKTLTINNLLNYTISHDDDDEPMIYEIPIDFAAQAREERARLIAEGASPDSIIFEYEVRDHVARVEGESPEDYAARYVQTFNDMMERGVVITFWKGWSVDTVWSEFYLPDQRIFDLGPDSGVTRGEYREFAKWFDETWEQRWEQEEKDGADEDDSLTPVSVPEKWMRFEQVNEKMSAYRKIGKVL